MAIFTFLIKRQGKKYVDEQPEEVTLEAAAKGQAISRAETVYRRRHQLAPQVALSVVLSHSETEGNDDAAELTLGQFRLLSGAFFESSVASLAAQLVRPFRLVRHFFIAGVKVEQVHPIVGTHIFETDELSDFQARDLMKRMADEIPATLSQQQFDSFARQTQSTWLAKHIDSWEYRYFLEVWTGSDWEVFGRIEPTNPTYPVGHSLHSLGVPG